MCLIFLFGVLYSTYCVNETMILDIDDLQKRLTPTWFDFKQDITDAAIDMCRPSGGHFEHVLWHECSFIRFIGTFYETVNVVLWGD